ncbi:MAG: hypothetical protein M3010_11140, partial [Candidatus Dormibacteraeota bacterium]|nr:hypothetical protein [Candidatus Dormibacteraeota bacterium]
KVRDLPVDLVLPGHGYEMTDLRGRVDEVLEHHARRVEKIEAILREPRTIYEVCQQVWPRLRAQDSHLAVREIIGHVALLKEEGRQVERTTRGDGALLWQMPN